MEHIEELDIDSWKLDELLRPLSDWNPDKERLYENFMVLGVEGGTKLKAKPTPTSLPAQNLYCYPPRSEVGSTVIPYIFPEGKVEIETIDKTQSLTDINQILFWQTSSLQTSEHSFVFQMGRYTAVDKNNVKKPLYIVGVMNRELVRDKLTLTSLIASPIIESKPRTQIQKTHEIEYAANRCYLIVTRTPYFKAHFEVLFTILAKEQMRRSCRRAKAKIPNGNEIEELLSSYYNARIPDRLEIYSLKIAGSDDPLKFTAYPESQIFQHWAVPPTLQTLSIANILTIFEALLLEHNVLVVSPYPGLVSNITYTFYRIIDGGIGWNGIFEPMAPPEVVKKFPLKFLSGVTQQPLGFPDGTILVDVESNKIVVPATVKLFGLPNSSDLELCLEKNQKIIKNATKTKRLESFKITTEQQNAAKEVMDEFNKYTHKLVEDVFEPAVGKKYESSTKHRDKVAPSLPKLDREFYKAFMSTRNFELLWKTETEKAKKLKDSKKK